jgi:hypothetical protein
MARILGLPHARLLLAALAMATAVSMNAGPANAVVYCRMIGVPKGCVARPAVAAPVVVAPVASPLSSARHMVSPKVAQCVEQ